MKDLISMIPRIKGKTSNANGLYLVFLLLLSGDIELNPGPGDPRDILRAKSDTLANLISGNLDRVAGKLNAKGLIPQQAVDDTSIAAYNSYRKAAALVGVLLIQLRSSNNPQRYFIDVCNVLRDKGLGDEALATLADDMLKELGSVQQGQMNGHAKGRASNGRTSNGRATVYTSSPSKLSIKDLKEVLDDLREGGFCDNSYYDLGLELGLYRRTLGNIKADSYIACLRECIARWLERADNVDGHGGANWTSLCNAVEKIDKAAADYIRDQHHIMPSAPSQPIEQANHQDHNEASQITSSNEGPRHRQKPSDATDNESKEAEETDSTPPSNPLVPEASSDKPLKWYEKKSVIVLVFCLVLLAFVVDKIFLNGYVKELLLAIIGVIHHFK
ncbi:PREDICTED: uncharacterized protein LOC109586860 [Amphimedon queenslandica]|uniref:Death domain-containing protein n=1 Tax=Amphimedon queenslandica TaxID=400682 RepID=A0A1X7TNB6_AMPQE|nr:PREDICTED: uncharacterized protein LOC109586860 [Amphimedon queenslandica]|eukprot:XP_019858647.1 PREDICTED: uncharacterized protein LOC109586860 [Amphimedon queenslandica]